MAKQAASINPYKDVNLSVPIDKDGIKSSISEESCLGKEWDMGSKECPICAMNDICGILYQDVVNQKVRVLESKHNTFLDKADFRNIDEDALLKLCNDQSGILTIDELCKTVSTQANMNDDVSVAEWVLSFKVKNNLKFRGGIVWNK